MKQTDLTRCTSELHVLNPSLVVSQTVTKEREQENAYAAEIRNKLASLVPSIDALIGNIDNIVLSEDALKTQKDELAMQKTKLNKENKKLEQSIRANRRRFLDNDPQEGTPSFLGFRTSDDKVLLFFWTALLLFTNLALFSYFAYTLKSSNRNIYIIVNILVLLFAYGILYYATKIEYKLRPTTL